MLRVLDRYDVGEQMVVSETADGGHLVGQQMGRPARFDRAAGGPRHRLVVVLVVQRTQVRSEP